MTTLSERASAFEAKFAHDEEFRFLATARRDKLFAVWAAERSELDGAARAALVESVCALPNGAGHDEKLFEMIDHTLRGRGRATARTDLAKSLEGCAAQARLQMLADPT